jgi:hypothetical protein
LLISDYRLLIVDIVYHGVGCWVLGVGCWVLGVGCWVLGVGCWLLLHSPSEAVNTQMDADLRRELSIRIGMDLKRAKSKERRGLYDAAAFDACSECVTVISSEEKMSE